MVAMAIRGFNKINIKINGNSKTNLINSEFWCDVQFSFNILNIFSYNILLSAFLARTFSIITI